MDTIYFKVPAWEWYSWNTEKLTFSDKWIVKERKMKGHNKPSLSTEKIKEKIQNPIGTSTLKKLATGKRKCCIIFDDATRPTKTYQILPAVLEELSEAGLTYDKIIFIMATGAHAGRTLSDFKKKLGPQIPEKFLIFNHNPYENFKYLGKTSHGTPVLINKEVMSCDLKVTIGSIIPHFSYGFGGGSKMILPGVSSIDTITHNHRITKGSETGRVMDNRRRLDSEEATLMAGLDFSINAFLNARCDVTDLVCGDVIDAHRAGLKIGYENYATEIVKGADIAVGNGYPMSNEGYKANRILIESVREGGDIVFLLYTPEGCRVHYYNGRFGTDYGGRGWKRDVYLKKPWKMQKIICVSPHLNQADEIYYGEGSTWVKSWNEAIRLLKNDHDKDSLVALYPTAAMQLSNKNIPP